MGRFQKLKTRKAAIDLGIVAAVALFFVAGVFFESRRSGGRLEPIAPSVGAETAPTDSSESTSEVQPESEVEATAVPTSSQDLATPVSQPVPAGTPNPEAVGQRVFLDLTGIENESVVEASEVTIVGTTTPDALVSVNGESVEVELGGSFSVDLALDPGPNFIEIVSSNLRGQETSRVISVVSIQ